MASEDVLEKIEKLSSRERQILELRCADLTGKDTAKKLHVSESTVKAEFTRIYVKFDLDQASDREKQKALDQVYCPALKGELDQQPPLWRRLPLGLIVIVFLAVLLVVLVIVGDLLPIDILGGGDETSEELSSQISEETPGLADTSDADLQLEPGVTSAAQAQEQEATELPAVASAPGVAPTEPSASASPTTPAVEAADIPAEVVATITPISLLFSDDFTALPKEEWNTELAEWIAVDGKYTITNVDPSAADWTTGISLIGNDNWQNYRVQVEVDLRNQQGTNIVAILVRVQDSKNYLALLFYDIKASNQARDDAAWYIVQDGEYAEVSGTSRTGYPKDKPFIITIEVDGNEINTLIDEVDFVSWGHPNLPFPSGKTGLYIQSRTIQNTATFDDFVVESLPP